MAFSSSSDPRHPAPHTLNNVKGNAHRKMRSRLAWARDSAAPLDDAGLVAEPTANGGGGNMPAASQLFRRHALGRRGRGRRHRGGRRILYRHHGHRLGLLVAVLHPHGRLALFPSFRTPYHLSLLISSLHARRCRSLRYAPAQRAPGDDQRATAARTVARPANANSRHRLYRKDPRHPRSEGGAPASKERRFTGHRRVRPGPVTWARRPRPRASAEIVARSLTPAHRLLHAGCGRLTLWPTSWASRLAKIDLRRA